MGRAEKLVVLLADEAIRWKETVEVLDVDIQDLVGNVFLSCACISYFGAFTGVYRKDLTDMWTEQCKERSIPCSEIFQLTKVMGDPVVIRGWNIDGLPTDNTSCENGILTTKAERFGLCIDPQQQANKWIKNMHKKDKTVLLKFGKATFLREISAAVNNGFPVLIEDVLENIDPGLDPILMHSEFVGDGGIKQIKLGDSTQDYDSEFKLYMTTKLPNPHYPPEVCIKVTLINFTVTFEGLEE
jgi:dynein heavy chain